MSLQRRFWAEFLLFDTAENKWKYIVSEKKLFVGSRVSEIRDSSAHNSADMLAPFRNDVIKNVLRDDLRHDLRGIDRRKTTKIATYISTTRAKVSDCRQPLSCVRTVEDTIVEILLENKG